MSRWKKFLSTVLLTLVLGCGVALVWASYRPGASYAAGETAAPAASPTTPAAARREITETSAQDVFNDYQHAQQKIAAEKVELERSRQDLEIAKAAIEARIVELKKLKAGLDTVRKEIRAETNHLMKGKVAHMVKICERMPPENTAKFLAGLQEQVAASILHNMTARRAAAALAEMEPSKAASLGRHYLANNHADEKSDLDAVPAPEPTRATTATPP